MYNKLFILLQHSVEVVYFSIIIWYTFTLSFTPFMQKTPKRLQKSIFLYKVFKIAKLRVNKSSSIKPHVPLFA